MTARRIIAIGDIHGCTLALDALLGAIEPDDEDLIVVLGDTVDHGYESRLVLDSLIELEKQCPLVCLRGNHEEMLLAARKSEGARRYWEQCGGVTTLNSYFFGATLDAIPDQHWRLLERTRNYFETERHLFVHANFDPDLPMWRQETHTLRWSLLDPSTTSCHNSGKTVIVGHTEQTRGEILDLGCVKCIDTACWRYGWLTALDVNSGHVWQASRFGQLRESKEPPVPPIREASD